MNIEKGRELKLAMVVVALIGMHMLGVDGQTVKQVLLLLLTDGTISQLPADQVGQVAQAVQHAVAGQDVARPCGSGNAWAIALISAATSLTRTWIKAKREGAVTDNIPTGA